MNPVRQTLIEQAETLFEKTTLRAVRSRAYGLLRLLSPLSYPLHRNENIAPFFVIGSGRCGTTLFRRLIQAQGNTYVPPENWSLGRCISQFHRYAWSMQWKDMVDLQVATLSHRSHHWFDTPPRPLVRRLHDLEENKRSLAAIIDASYRYHAEMNDRTPERWGDNSPGSVFSAELIAEVFPDAKFIHFLRDGVDVIGSWINYAPYKDDLEGSAQKWTWSVRKARDFMDKYPSKAIEVRYEELVSEPVKEMRRICSFLDHPFTPSRLEEGSAIDSMGDIIHLGLHEKVRRPISTDSIGKGRRQLDQKQKAIIKPMINDLLQRVGYEPVATDRI